MSDTAEEREVSTVCVSGAVGAELAGDTNAIVTITEMAASLRSMRRTRRSMNEYALAMPINVAESNAGGYGWNRHGCAGCRVRH